MSQAWNIPCDSRRSSNQKLTCGWASGARAPGPARLSPSLVSPVIDTRKHLCSVSPLTAAAAPAVLNSLCKPRTRRVPPARQVLAPWLGTRFLRRVSLSLVGWAGWTTERAQGHRCCRMGETQGLRAHISKGHLLTSCTKCMFLGPASLPGRGLKYMHFKQALTIREPQRDCAKDLRMLSGSVRITELSGWESHHCPGVSWIRNPSL